MLAYGDWLEENVLAPVPHRQYVFSLPNSISYAPMSMITLKEPPMFALMAPRKGVISVLQTG